MYNLAYIPVLTVYLEEKLDDVYVVCMSMDEKRMYQYENCTILKTTSYQNFKRELVPFVKNCVYNLNERLKKCSSSQFKKIKYIVVSELADIWIVSEDFEKEKCEVYQCGQGLLEKLSSVDIQDICNYLNERSIVADCDEIPRISQIIAVFKKLRKGPSLNQTIGEFVQDVIQKLEPYFFQKPCFRN